MDEAAKLIINYFQKKAKATPGLIVGLHTFGSKVNFNPHVHMLVTMGGLTRKENISNTIIYLLPCSENNGKQSY
ncbi:MAG: transposase [Bacillaceae bacterium]|nr:transposase [Bacillaceae bacterium]